MEPEARGVLASEGMLTALTARVEAAEEKVDTLMAWQPTCEATTQDLHRTIERLEASTQAQVQDGLKTATEASSQAVAQAAEEVAEAARAQSAAVEESVASLAAGLERERKERAAGVLAAAREAQDTLGQVIILCVRPSCHPYYRTVFELYPLIK